MNVYIITACYNYAYVLSNYIISLNKAIDRYHPISREDKDYINPVVIFVNDDPSLIGFLDYTLLRYDNKFEYRIIDNFNNLGVSRSRNNGLRYVLDYMDPGIITYFDVDDTWDENAIVYMADICSAIIYGRYDIIFSPVDNGRPIHRDLLYRSVPMTEFLTKIPMQECIYFWSYNYVTNFYKEHGYLWYEDDSDSKYFPEDIMFHMDLNTNPYITSIVICHRDYSKGNITKDWDDTIRKNKSAFRKLIELHEKTSKLVEYPEELKVYVDYLRELVEE